MFYFFFPESFFQMFRLWLAIGQMEQKNYHIMVSVSVTSHSHLPFTVQVIIHTDISDCLFCTYAKLSGLLQYLYLYIRYILIIFCPISSKLIFALDQITSSNYFVYKGIFEGNVTSM